MQYAGPAPLVLDKLQLLRHIGIYLSGKKVQLEILLL